MVLSRLSGTVGCLAVVAQCMAEQWRLKPEVSWVRLPATAGFFTFLYFCLITSKFIYCLWVTKVSKEVNGRTVRIVESALYIIDGHYGDVSTKWGSTVGLVKMVHKCFYQKVLSHYFTTICTTFLYSLTIVYVALKDSVLSRK